MYGSGTKIKKLNIINRNNLLVDHHEIKKNIKIYRDYLKINEPHRKKEIESLSNLYEKFNTWPKEEMTYKELKIIMKENQEFVPKIIYNNETKNNEIVLINYSDKFNNTNVVFIQKQLIKLIIRLFNFKENI